MTPLPVLTEALTPERVRELRDQWANEVAAMNSHDLDSSYPATMLAICDHWLRTQAGQPRVTGEHRFRPRPFNHENCDVCARSEFLPIHGWHYQAPVAPPPQEPA